MKKNKKRLIIFFVAGTCLLGLCSKNDNSKTDSISTYNNTNDMANLSELESTVETKKEDISESNTVETDLLQTDLSEPDTIETDLSDPNTVDTANSKNDLPEAETIIATDSTQKGQNTNPTSSQPASIVTDSDNNEPNVVTPSSDNISNNNDTNNIPNNDVPSSAEAPTPADNDTITTPNTNAGENNFDTYNTPEQQLTTNTYVLNQSSKKIHYPSCSSVPKIAPDNYATSSQTIDELKAQGYSTCGNCFK